MQRGKIEQEDEAREEDQSSPQPEDVPCSLTTATFPNNLKDEYGNDALEYAVQQGNLQMVKTLLECEKSDLSLIKTFDIGTLLHIASQKGYLDIVEYLVTNGGDVNAINSRGSKPIHVAAEEGHEDIVEYFLSKGMSVNEIENNNRTLIHYASSAGKLQIVKYLITKSVEINVKDISGLTPMHNAALSGHKDVVEELLRNGAYYNAVDNLNRKPSDVAKNGDVIALLRLIITLFNAVRSNNHEQIEKWVKAGNAYVNVKGTDGASPLHWAAWKGYGRIVDILLGNKADPNAVTKKGSTSLHYACKFSHFKTAISLLCNGAVYNAPTANGHTPLDHAKNEQIRNLLKLTRDSFRNVKNDSSQVIDALKKIKDANVMNAIMRCRDEENKTLLDAAIKSNFTEIDILTCISRESVREDMEFAAKLFDDPNSANDILTLLKIFRRKVETLECDNPSILDTQTEVAKSLYTHGKYREALNLINYVFEKQRRTLAFDDRRTLYTRTYMALVLDKLGECDTAYIMLKVVFRTQKELLGPRHSNTLETENHLKAMTLERQSIWEPTLKIGIEHFEITKSKFGPDHLYTLDAMDYMAFILSYQNKYEKAIEIYKQVFEKKKAILGIYHGDTLRAWDNIALALCYQHKFDEAIETNKKVSDARIKTFGANNARALLPQRAFAAILLKHNLFIPALRIYFEGFEPMKTTFGRNHFLVSSQSQKIEGIKKHLKVKGRSLTEVLKQVQRDINVAVCNCNIATIQTLLRYGYNINEKDFQGRTPLIYAVNSNQIKVVKMLLKNGADVTRVTNTGNTPLHIAVLKSYKEIVEILLNHAKGATLRELINAKTTAGGTTALHVSAKNGDLDTLKLLLKFGAVHDIKNRKGETPLNLSKDRNVSDLLELIETLFKDVKNCHFDMESELEKRHPDEIKAILYAQDETGNTLSMCALNKGYRTISIKLLEMIKKLMESE